MLAAEEKPNRPKRRVGKMDDRENDRLCRRLSALCDRWEAYEGERRERDRKGIRLFRGQNSIEGFNDARLMINSQAALALYERVVADVLRGQPEPEVEATNDDEEDAARIAQGAIRTNWRNTRMREKMANGYRLSGFTRAVGMYHYWRHEMHGGIGDVDKRVIPGHRLIVDDRTPYTADMEYVGFEEEMSRSKLIMLFPDKADDIEEAANASGDRVAGLTTDPLRPSGGNGAAGARVYDRLVTTASTQTPPYTPVTSIRSAMGKRGKGDPLSETVKVRFLWIDDPTPKRETRPRFDPKTKRHVYSMVRDEEGRPQFDHEGHDVVDTPAGPQYVPRLSPRTEMVMEDVVVRKYKYWRHVAYVPMDNVVLWDVSWEGPVPISILRDRLPAYGFDAPGTALRLSSLSSARNVLWTIIFERLRKSLAGTWLTTPGSNLRRNQLTNEIGNVYTVNSVDAVKEFPQSPLDHAYFGLLDKIETEMALLLGVTPMMQGQPAGRADSPQTYDTLADMSGGLILDRAKMIDQFIADAATIDLWFIQNNYTHEHVVEAETSEGFSTWREASSLLMRGDFAVKIETGSTLQKQSSRDLTDAQSAAQMGIYALPMLAKQGHIKHWQAALKQHAAILKMGPQFAWLLGPAGAPPATKAQNVRSQQGVRSHHQPGSGR
jgi:hypothetical protein